MEPKVPRPGRPDTLAQWAPALVALCCCLGALPLLNDHPPATSDGLYHLLRAVELDQQLRAGVLLPRWAPDFYLGYGYPILLFTPLLPYYLVEVVHLAGLPFLPAMGVVEAAGLVASGLFAYAWLARRLPAAAAAVGAVLYALAAYHLVNLYYRGDLSEFLAATWFPAILLAVDVLIERPGLLNVLLLALALAALVLTHFLSALLFLPVALVVALCLLTWQKPLVLLGQAAAGLVSALLGAGLTATSWLPAVTSSADATFAKLLRFYNYHDNFATARQLFSLQPLHHYAYVFTGSGTYGYQLGLVQSVASVAGICALILLWRRLPVQTRVVTVALVLLGAAALAGCLSFSAPVWLRVAPLQLVQFPWRLLAIAAVPAAWLGALAVAAVRAPLRSAVAILACAVVAGSSLLVLRPLRMDAPTDLASVQGISRFELLYHLAGTSAAAEYLPPWAAERQTTSALAFSRATGLAVPADPAASVSRWLPSGDEERFALHQAADGAVVLPLLYFPGWQAAMDNRAVSLRAAPTSGLAMLPVPAGTHVVVVRYVGSETVRLGDTVSLAALAAVLGVGVVAAWAWIRRRKRRAGRPDLAAVGGPASGKGTRQRIVAPAAILTSLLCLVALAFGVVGSQAAGMTWQPLDATLAYGVTMRGYAFEPHATDDAGTGSVPAGSAVHLRLAGSTPSGAVLAIRLTNAAGTDWADRRATLGADLTDVTLPLPADLPPGPYTLRLGAARGGGAPDFRMAAARLVRLLPVDGTLDLGPLIVAPAAGADTPPSPRAPASAVWPGRATLSAPSVPAQAPAGTALALQWVWWADSAWHANERLAEAIHLTDAAGHVFAAADTEPADGYYPTSFWRPDQQVLDRPVLRIPADVPSGRYTVSVSLLSTGRPLPAHAASGAPLGDDVSLGRVVVLPPEQPAPFGGPSVTVGPLQVQLAAPAGSAVAGAPLPLTVRWHLTSAPGSGLSVRLELRQGGQVVASTTVQPGSAAYPLASWRTGETEVQVVELAIPAAAVAGQAQLIVSLNGPPPGNPRLLGAVEVAGRPHVFTASPTIRHVAQFGDGIALQGYDLRVDGTTAGNGTVQARRALDVTLYWKAAGPTATPLKVTVQLLDGANHLVAQDDTEPEGGRAPSTSWLAGEIVTSAHHLDASTLPPGRYSLIVAVYDAATGTRVSAPSGDAEPLTTVVVP